VRGTVLITGSTDGLGKRVADRLEEGGTTVLRHGRSPDKLGAGGYLADLSSLDEVRRLGEEVRRDHDSIDVLVNNAGVIVPERRTSRDGHELTFAVNHLAGFLLTAELLPILGRVVNVASAGQQAIDFDDPMLERGYEAYPAYAQSKLAQVMFTFDLAERGVTANALHPATLMDTKMVREGLGRSRSTVEEGAEATQALIERDDVSGRYFDGLEEARANAQAYDEDARRRLWDLSQTLTMAPWPDSPHSPRS